MTRTSRRRLLQALGGAAAVAGVSTVAGASTTQTFAGGDGTESSPYQVETAEHLAAVGDDLAAHYEQTADIELGSGSTVAPINPGGTPLTGSYTGNGNAIRGLTIEDTDSNRVGLFTLLDGVVRDLSLEDVSVSAGDGIGTKAGALAALARSETVLENVSVDGTVTGGYDAAMVAGEFSGVARNVSASGETNTRGGLVARLQPNFGEGFAGARIENSSASVTVTEGGGGAVGTNLGLLSNVSTESDVSGGNTGGGLVALNRGFILDCAAAGPVSTNTPCGGLVGENKGDGYIARSMASGPIEGSGSSFGSQYGGLVGLNHGLVEECYATGSLTMDAGQRTHDFQAGGLVGINSGKVRDAYATGSITERENPAQDYRKVGGVAGSNEGSIERTYATGELAGQDIEGGVAGDNHSGGTISQSYWDVETTGVSSSAGLPDENGLQTAAITGEGAAENLAGFDFETVWTTTDSYPDLAWDTPRPARLDVGKAGLNDEKLTDDSGQLGAKVILFNRGDEAVSHTVDLRVDGVTIARKQVDVPGRRRVPVDFTLGAPRVPADGSSYSLHFGNRSYMGNLSVETDRAGTNVTTFDDVAATPTATGNGDAGTAASSTGRAESTGADATTQGSGPGFGVVSAVAGAAGALAYRRRRSED